MYDIRSKGEHSISHIVWGGGAVLSNLGLGGRLKGPYGTLIGRQDKANPPYGGGGQIEEGVGVLSFQAKEGLCGLRSAALAPSVRCAWNNKVLMSFSPGSSSVHPAPALVQQ